MTAIKELVITILCIGVSIISYAQMDYSPGFNAGKPIEMEQIGFLEGDWDITLKWTNDLSKDTAAWYVIGTSKSTFSKVYDGTFIKEESDGFPIKGGHEGFSRWEYTSLYSYDRFQQKYRYVAFDNILGLADIYEGDFEENSLILSNQNTSTFNNHGSNQSAQKNKFVLKQLSETSFEITWYNIDKNKLISENPASSPWDFAIYMRYEKSQE